MKPLISKHVMEDLKAYCKNRNYKCKGCTYSVRKPWIKDAAKYSTCIFANCPCDWEADNE